MGRSLLMKTAYCVVTGLSSPSFSVTSTRHARRACSPPHWARAGSFGAMKKITNVTNVMIRKRRIAQRIRLTRYRNIRSLLLV